MSEYVLSRKDERLGLEAWVSTGPKDHDNVHIYFVATPASEDLKKYWLPYHPELVSFLNSKRRRVYLVTKLTPPCLVMKI